MLHRPLPTQSWGRVAHARKPPLTSNVRQRRKPIPSGMGANQHFVSLRHRRQSRFSLRRRLLRGVPASASAWAVRPSAASARSVAVQVVFLPVWSRVPGQSDLAGSWNVCACIHRLRTLRESVMRPLQRLATVSKCSSSAWPNPELQMLEVSTHQRRVRRLPSQASSPVVLSRSGHLAAQSGPPNISVKGTSCGKPQAAPYVER